MSVLKFPFGFFFFQIAMVLLSVTIEYGLSFLTFGQILGTIIIPNLGATIFVGSFIVTKKLKNGETATFSDFFQGFSYSVQFFIFGIYSFFAILFSIIASFVLATLIYQVFVPIFLKFVEFFLKISPWLGILSMFFLFFFPVLLAFFPTIVIIAQLSFGPYLIVDKNLSARGAYFESQNMINSGLSHFILLGFSFFAFPILGMAILIFSSILSLPQFQILLGNIVNPKIITSFAFILIFFGTLIFLPVSKIAFALSYLEAISDQSSDLIKKCELNSFD